MSKRSITDFFKPFAFPREKTHEVGLEGPRPSPSERSRSNTPHAALGPVKEQSRPTLPSNNIALISSQSSDLSSLHGLLPSTPEEKFKQSHEKTPTVRPNGNQLNQSFAEAVSAPQLPILSSSQRTIINGEVVIRDSDEERSDTDISLDDLDDIIASHRPPLASAPSSEDGLPLLPSPRVTRSKTPKINSRGRSKLGATKAKQEAIPVAIPKFKIPLEALIKQRQDDDRTQLSLQNAKALLDGLDKQTTAAFANGSAVLDEDLLATVIKDEDDGSGMEKLMGAIERTEALDLPKTWSFFSNDSEDIAVESPKCPPVTDRYWKNIFEDPIVRQQAFLGGYVRDYASCQNLPDELLLWLLDAACLEVRVDLHYSYCQTLRAVSSQIAHCLNVSKCDQLFECIGARPESLDFEKEVIPTVASSDASALRASGHTKLRRTLDTLEAVVNSMKPEVQSHTLCTLSRLLLDRGIVNDSIVLGKIEDLMITVIDSFSYEGIDQEFTNALTPIYNSVEDLGLQLQLLQYLPASSTRLHLLRRRLAFAFFFHDETYLSRQKTPLVDIEALVHRLDKTQSNISRETNYPNLAASIAILAIGLDNGDPPSPGEDKSVEMAFNDNIDALAQRIKSMFTQIADTGASHMKRTEAKEVLESFYLCLVYAVRTRQKPRGMMWGDDTDIEKQQSMMNSFARRERP